MDRLSLKYVWKQQKEIPVVLRRVGKGERLRVKLPYADNNRYWLRDGRSIKPEWFGHRVIDRVIGNFQRHGSTTSSTEHWHGTGRSTSYSRIARRKFARPAVGML